VTISTAASLLAYSFTKDPHLPDLLTHSGLYSVFSLINIAELSNVLHPDTYGAGVPPQERLFLIHVRMRARMLRAWITARYLITRMTNGKSKRYHADALADGHLVYQTAAMRTRKVTYDTANVIHGVPAFNAQDLDRELDLCSPGLTKDHPTSSTLPCLSHSTKYEDIKIQAYSTPGLVSSRLFYQMDCYYDPD
jgi:hypothetical protein